MIAVFLGSVFLAAVLLSFIPKKSIRDSLASPVEDIPTLSDQEQVTAGLPVRLEIPVIQVDSKIIPLGLTPEGAMDVPKDPDEAAWFTLGVRPGENGSAIITGHYGWKNNKSAIFDNLHKLQAGDEIMVEDEKGLITIFVVREIRTYDKDEAVPDVFASSDGKPHLNLITCMGDWDNAERTFSNRLIVFADKQ